MKSFEEQVNTLEDEIAELNDKLSAAQSEMTNKENLVKQHAKVAEEAVSGWMFLIDLLCSCFKFLSKVSSNSNIDKFLLYRLGKSRGRSFNTEKSPGICHSFEAYC